MAQSKFMQTPSVTRREFLKQSLVIAGPMVAAATFPLSAAASEAVGARPLKVCCIGAHPDDPDSRTPDMAVNKNVRFLPQEGSRIA